MVEPWDAVRSGIIEQAGRIPYARRRKRMLYASSIVPDDSATFEARMKPIRQEFVRQCLRRCASRRHVASFVDVEHWDENATRVLRELKQASAEGARGLQFSYKCLYHSILVLQGRSAWLDHWKVTAATEPPAVSSAPAPTPGMWSDCVATPADGPRMWFTGRLRS